MKTESVRIQRELGEDSGGRSKRDLYCDLIVGRRGFRALLKYELIVLFCSGMPGALGLWLRSKLYPLLLKRCGRNVTFGANVVLRHPNKIEIGDNVVVDDNCLLDAKGRDNEGIRLGDGVFLGRNSILSCKNGDIVLEHGVNIGFNSEVFSGSRVVIGEESLVAAYCYFIGGDHDARDTGRTVAAQGSTSRGITVGRNCWFGAAVKVLDGVTIGPDSILGAGAVVTRDIPGGSVAVGVPARVTGTRESGPEPGC
jgi:acetyltransferase-like isoleucine patch superfamily enzyme